MNSICDVLFISLEACFLRITRKSTEILYAFFMMFPERFLWKLRALVYPYISYLVTRVRLETYHLPPCDVLLATYFRNV